MKNKFLLAGYRAYMVIIYFLAIVGAMFMFYNWKALLVEPFEKQVKVINIKAEAQVVSPLPKK